MNRDSERTERIRQVMRDAGFDLLVCALPLNVLLLSGYWPVVGDAIAVFTTQGEVELIVPEDETSIAERSWADTVSTFASGSLTQIKSFTGEIKTVLTERLSDLATSNARIGYEHGPSHVPASYLSTNTYGHALLNLLSAIFPKAHFEAADEHLSLLRSRLTPDELARLRTPCAIAAGSYTYGRTQLHIGETERQVADAFRTRLVSPQAEFPPLIRAEGFAFCMSGPNSYRASAAYQISSGRHIQVDDLVLVHCNSCADGFWTDITRTFAMNAANDFQRKLLETVLLARQAAIDEIRPGVNASDVDTAARSVILQNGFESEFSHGLGHGVGFVAIDHNALPILHPASSDRLETGMVFNIEPAIYIENYGGVRHCDMIAVTENGTEILTPFLCTTNSLIAEQGF